jgi:hypothetical protein
VVDLNLPHVRTTERRDFKRCQQRWWWAWRQGLKPIESANALWFGIGIHEALAQYYQLGYKRDSKGALEIWDAYCEDDNRVITTTSYEDEHKERKSADVLGRGMLQGYFQHWGEDRNWDVIAIEKPFTILVPDPDEPDTYVAYYDGTYDGVIYDQRDKQFKILEHKTATSISFKHLPLDDQAGSYLWVATEELRHAGLLSRKQRISGIQYNFLRKALPDDRPRNAQGLALNKDGSISKSQPPAFFEREFVTRNQMARINMAHRVAEEVHQMGLIREGYMSPMKTPTRDCSWDCSFYELCLLHEDGQDWEEFRDALFRVEDPYADHRKSTDG